MADSNKVSVAGGGAIRLRDSSRADESMIWMDVTDHNGKTITVGVTAKQATDLACQLEKFIESGYVQ